MGEPTYGLQSLIFILNFKGTVFFFLLRLATNQNSHVIILNLYFHDDDFY